MYTKKEFSKTNMFYLSFLLYIMFLLRWVNSKKFELILHQKNMKTKENCFKSFNDAKVVLNKKNPKNVEVMYVRDFRASVPVCKDIRINIKNIKNSCYSSHIIALCIQVFRIIYVLPSYNKVFFPGHICSFILSAAVTKRFFAKKVFF